MVGGKFVIVSPFPVVCVSAILGSQADIHTGGVDLKFPHHDNEIAQAEVCVKCIMYRVYMYFLIFYMTG